MNPFDKSRDQLQEEVNNYYELLVEARILIDSLTYKYNICEGSELLEKIGKAID